MTALFHARLALLAALVLLAATYFYVHVVRRRR
jgi:hypothetical protein